MSRPSAIVLTPRLPWPLDDGGRIYVHQSIWSVSRTHDTTVVSLVPPAEMDSPEPAAFAALGVRLVRVPHRPPATPVAALRGLFGRWPYMLARYRNAALDATIRRLIAERRPEFVLTNGLHVTTYVDAFDGVPAILRTPDLVHLWLSRFAERARNPAVRWYARNQVRRMADAERDLASRCALVLPIREEEAVELRRLAPAAHVEYLPLGIDLDRYRPHAPESPPVVALVGSWDWAPNVDGGREFLERGWSRVRAQVPGARLRLAGKHVSPAFAALAERAGAEVVGYVDDMAVEFARASVMVVPLWMGSGVRVKIVEAMAARLPVASTPIGAEGLGLEPGVHAAFGDTPEALGDVVASLLLDTARAEAMAAAARRLAEERYSLAAVAERQRVLCEQAVARAASGRRP